MTNLFASHLLGSLNNTAVEERQNANGRSDDQLVQDVATTVALNVFGDPSVVSNMDLSRQMQEHVPRTTTVQFRHSDGSTEPMSLHQARKALKEQRKQPMSFGDSASPHPCPTQPNFWRNHGPPSAVAAAAPTVSIPDKDRRRRNKLSDTPLSAMSVQQQQPPLQLQPAGITPSTSSAMVTRVQKRARAIARSEDTTPNTKKMAKRVYRGIVNDDGAVLQAIQDCEEDDEIQNSQETVSAVGELLWEDEE